MSSTALIAAKLAGAIFDKIKGGGAEIAGELEERTRALAAASSAHFLAGLVGEAQEQDAKLLKARALALESAGISGVAALVNEGITDFVTAGIGLVFEALT